MECQILTASEHLAVVTAPNSTILCYASASLTLWLTQTPFLSPLSYRPN